MSERERIISLLDHVPDCKLGYVLAYVQGITDDDVPNAETAKAIEDARNGIGLSKSFSTVAELMEDLNADDSVSKPVSAGLQAHGEAGLRRSPA